MSFLNLPAAGGFISRPGGASNPFLSKPNGQFYWDTINDPQSFADGDPISALSNLYPGSSNTITSSGTSRPTVDMDGANGFPQLVFDGADDRMLSNTGVGQTGDQAFSIYCLVSDPGSADVIYGWGNASDFRNPHLTFRLGETIRSSVWGGSNNLEITGSVDVESPPMQHVRSRVKLVDVPEPLFPAVVKKVSERDSANTIRGKHLHVVRSPHVQLARNVPPVGKCFNPRVSHDAVPSDKLLGKVLIRGHRVGVVEQLLQWVALSKRTVLVHLKGHRSDSITDDVDAPINNIVLRIPLFSVPLEVTGHAVLARIPHVAGNPDGARRLAEKPG